MRIIAFDRPRYQAQREYLKDMKFIFSSELLTTRSELTWFFYHSQIFRKITIFQEIVKREEKIEAILRLRAKITQDLFHESPSFLEDLLSLKTCVMCDATRKDSPFS